LPVVDRSLQDPRVLTRALEIGVTCIAAHCGTGTVLLDKDYFSVWAKMTKTYPNLYGDNSAFATPNIRFRRSTLAQCMDPDVVARIVHGSDSPVPVHGILAVATGMISRAAFRRSLAEANPLERDVLLKRAMGFPETSFTTLSELLRLKESQKFRSI
jgi:hypothetical protein